MAGHWGSVRCWMETDDTNHDNNVAHVPHRLRGAFRNSQRESPLVRHPLVRSALCHGAGASPGYSAACLYAARKQVGIPWRSDARPGDGLRNWGLRNPRLHIRTGSSGSGTQCCGRDHQDVPRCDLVGLCDGVNDRLRRLHPCHQRGKAHGHGPHVWGDGPHWGYNGNAGLSDD